MMNFSPSSLLERALHMSRELLAMAESGELCAAAHLGAERLRLLQLAGAGSLAMSADDRRVLQEIAGLNDRALGLVQHRRRIKEREIDTAAVGRRAVDAYSSTGMCRGGPPDR